MSEQQPPEGYSDVQHAAAAYMALMDAVVPESQYWQGAREDSEKIQYLGDIVQRPAACRREEERRGGRVT